MCPPPTTTRSGTAAVHPAPPRRSGVSAATGGTTTVTTATRLFHVKFQFKNPLTDALVPFPAGLLAHLFDRTTLVGAAVTLNASGYAALPFTPSTASGSARPDFHFVVRPAVRSYIDLAGGTLVRADALGRTDSRNLFEMPLEMDTAVGNFTHGAIAGFAAGKFTDYAGAGEGTASAPLLFTLDLHWYPLRFDFYNIVMRRVTSVGRDMSVQARINNKTYPEAMEDLSFVGNFAAMTTVRGRQQRLKWLGFHAGAVDGNESPEFAVSVRSFQGRSGIPQNGTFDAATSAMLEEIFYARRVSVMSGETYLVPVLAKSPAHPVAHIDFQVKQENLHVFTNGRASTPAILLRTQAQIDALTYPVKFRYYDLPSFWTSEGANFRRGNDLVNPLKWGDIPAAIQCYPAGATAIPKDNPLVVNLDDMVLLRDATHLETVAAGDNYAVFDLMGDVVEPNADEPYLSDARNRNGNYFPCQDGGAFAVYFKGKYYFAHGKRVPANLRRAGLRAAVLNDHVNRAIREPVVEAAGNLEENYFHAVDLRNDKIISYVICLWTCKFQRIAGASAADRQTIDDGILAYKQSGLTNCKLRHEEPDFDILDKQNRAPLMVKVLKHFVAWDDAGRKCTVTVHNGNGRDNMGLTSASFNAANWEAWGGGWASAAGRFTAAHELGHAMGLDDDYLEPPGAWGNDGWTSPVIPRFAQWVKGNPLAGDSNSLMNSNEEFRHRMVFHHVDWLNSDAAIRRLTGDIRFMAKNPQHEYYLPPKQDRNFLATATRHIHYMPVLSAAAHNNGAHGRMDLVLYKLGRDQTCRNIVAGQDFDSILCVILYIRWNFQGGAWTEDEKRTFIQGKYGALLTLINQKKYLGTSEAGSTYFRKIYLQFRLCFHEGGNSDENSELLAAGHIPWHFTVNVQKTVGGTAPRAPSYHTAGFQASTLDVDQSSAQVPWFRYMLGLDAATITPGTGTPPGPATVTETTTVSNADLAFLSTWANSALNTAGIGAGYTVRDF